MDVHINPFYSDPKVSGESLFDTCDGFPYISGEAIDRVALPQFIGPVYF